MIAYKKERDYMQKKQIQEINKSRIIVGSPVSLNVAAILGRIQAPKGCKWLPAVVVENCLSNGWYQVRVKALS